MMKRKIGSMTERDTHREIEGNREGGREGKSEGDIEREGRFPHRV